MGTHDIMKSAQIEEVDGSTPETWWSSIKNAADEIRRDGGQPIVLVSSTVEPRWLHDWIWNRDRSGKRSARPADLHISRSESSTPDGYEIHLNDMQVFRAPVERNCSYVLSGSLLQRIEFTKLEDGHHVRVEFLDDEEDPWHGDLRATWWRRVTLGRGKIVRVAFKEALDD